MDQHVCLFIFLPPSLFLSLPVCCSSSPLTIYIYFKLSCFLTPPPTTTILCSPFPLPSHMPRLFLGTKLSYLNTGTYRDICLAVALQRWVHWNNASTRTKICLGVYLNLHNYSVPNLIKALEGSVFPSLHTENLSLYVLIHMAKHLCI